jgi:hypothetical protein
MRYSHSEIEAFSNTVLSDGLCILRDHFPLWKLDEWREQFLPLLRAHIDKEGQLQNRGPARYYVTLPFIRPFADEQIFADPDVLAIVEKLVGADFTMVQLATDTPLLGSDYQELHRDAPPLFPELAAETPPFQLAVNFPLVDVTAENGPFEVALGTHMTTKDEALAAIQDNKSEVTSLLMNAGDVMVRDVRGIHRGSPNKTNEPRPMCVIGYSRRWLFRPEVSIQIPHEIWTGLAENSKKMLRFNPRVESIDLTEKREVYQAFAY